MPTTTTTRDRPQRPVPFGPDRRNRPVTQEQRRLHALETLEIPSTPDVRLDEICALVAEICDTPAAAISLVEADQIWFRSRKGIAAQRVRRQGSPCDETILGDEVFQIPDSRKDAHSGRGFIAVGDQNFRFYAGAPIRISDGQAIGVLCVLHPEPRHLNVMEANTLRTFAHQVGMHFELNLRIRNSEREARTRQRVESALTVERNFVSAVLDTVGALVVVLDTAGRIVRFNRICETISGFALTDVAGHTLWDTLIPEEEREDEIRTFEHLRDGSFPFEYENRWRTRDGRVRRIQWTATPLLDSQKQAAFLIATGIDVTLQRQAEVTLRESEARYRQLIEGSLGAVFTHDADGILLSLNTYGAENLGYRAEDMLGRPVSHFMTPASAAEFDQYLVTLMEEGEAQGTFELLHRNGEAHVLAYRNRLMEEAQDEPYALCFAVDITEKVRAEEQLSELTSQSNSILDSVGDGIFGTDLNGVLTVCNPAGAEMLGYKPEEIATEILGHNIHKLAHHSHPDGNAYDLADCPILNSVRGTKTVRVASEVFWRKDGTSFPVEYVACPIVKEGRPTGIVVAFTDTTERRALDRMKDEFVSTVSHELRTPLTSMRASLGLIASGALQSRPEKQRQMLDIAIGNTDRLVNLVNDILELERIGSGKAELQRGQVDAGSLMRRASELLSTPAAKAGIEFRIDDPGVTIWADADRIIQTLTNLISNAIKFSPNGGTITLRAAKVSLREARIEVQDQGRGIPVDKLESIFERFQQVDASDSRQMGGTGLGLAICRSIVTQHGGRIWAESQPGKGAKFLFTLPTQQSRNLR